MFRVKGILSLVGMIFAMAASLQTGTVYNATGDYLAGWTAGNNPNGVWSYGWSTTPGSALTLYTVQSAGIGGYSSFDSWYDSTNYILGTPTVYLNSGSLINDSQIDHLPAGALVIHGGGTSTSCGTAGACFSEVVWTAPSTGFVDLSAVFTGRQYTITQGLVEIVDASGGNSTTLLSGFIYDQTSQSLNELISVQAGDTLTFATRSNTGLNADTTQLQATLMYTVSQVPEPSTFALMDIGLVSLAEWRRRK